MRVWISILRGSILLSVTAMRYFSPSVTSRLATDLLVRARALRLVCGLAPGIVSVTNEVARADGCAGK